MRIVTINSGSSSIKFSLIDMGSGERVLFSGSASGIGFRGGRFHVTGPSGRNAADLVVSLPDHGAAMKEIVAWLWENADGRDVHAIGHRLVHGGSRYTEPRRIDDDLLAALNELVPFAPDHLPHEIDAIRSARTAWGNAEQVACFDTSFHRAMPAVAQRYALPDDVRRHGVLRYGFHGLSYEFILSELERLAGAGAGRGRVIVAHLGNGASMGAFREGASRDTTMGFTPAGGLVMSTRSGDLDPGVIVYLLRNKGLNADELNRMINTRSGLAGLSGTSADMRELLSRERDDPRAASAVELFCYQAKKFLGALTAVLGGIDTLVFTGGIGENAAAVRERICRGLEFLGIRLDGQRNDIHASVISPEGSPVTVRVMRTNEELMIARHTHRLLRRQE
jgi:acetate kinase